MNLHDIKTEREERYDRLTAEMLRVMRDRLWSERWAREYYAVPPWSRPEIPQRNESARTIDRTVRRLSEALHMSLIGAPTTGRVTFHVSREEYRGLMETVLPDHDVSFRVRDGRIRLYGIDIAVD